jgi:hypothetical protein
MFSIDQEHTAYGSFIFDADTSNYLSINITTTSGSAFGGEIYDESHPTWPGNAGWKAALPEYSANLMGSMVLRMFYTPSLTNSGGTITGFSGSENRCTTTNCSGSSPLRSFVAGQLTGVAVVPEPSTFALLGLGLVGIGVARRKV